MDRHEVSEEFRKNVFKQIQSISENRKESYGPAEESFQRIAHLWNGYFTARGCCVCITPADVSFLMSLFKMAREMNKHDYENILDGVNYFAFGGGFRAASEFEKKMGMEEIFEDEDYEGVGKDPEPGEVIFVSKPVSDNLIGSIADAMRRTTKGGLVRG
jgi:hypothetical protein